MENKSKKQLENTDSSTDKLLLSDVIKSVCPKCKSDDWDNIGKNCRCNKCNKRWKQTVL